MRRSLIIRVPNIVDTEGINKSSWLANHRASGAGVDAYCVPPSPMAYFIVWPVDALTPLPAYSFGWRWLVWLRTEPLGERVRVLRYSLQPRPFAQLLRPSSVALCPGDGRRVSQSAVLTHATIPRFSCAEREIGT
eukprot:6212423-Pleurochrysis_carterae.AAC.2